MKILFLSRHGDGLDLAVDMKRYGHEVRCWINEPDCRKEVYEGMIEKTDDWKKEVEWCDWAFFDANKLSDLWEVISKTKPCFGGSPEGEKMEKDRDFAHGLMEEAGMKVLKSDTFKTIPEVVAFLKKEKKLKVCKVVGGDADSEDVLIGEREDCQDSISLLERYLDSGKKYDEVEVEDRILGVEVGCAGYFNGKDWVGPIEINFQFKEIAAGRPGSSRGLGALCGETGTVIKYVSRENKFFKKTLDKFSDHLRKIDYRGEIDIGTMTNEKGIFPIEFTPRKGYPDCMIRRALAKTPEPDIYVACATGKDIDVEVLKGWAIGYLVMVPGFPYEEAVKGHSAGYPVIDYDEKNPNMHLMEVKKGKRGIEVAGGCGYVAVVTGRGMTIEAAQRNAYWQVNEDNKKRLYIPKMSVRADIGERVLSQKEQILALGVLTESEWDD